MYISIWKNLCQIITKKDIGKHLCFTDYETNKKHCIMIINLKCKYCKYKIEEETETILVGEFESKCENCGKKNIWVFPDDLKLESFYKNLEEQGKVFFQKYFLEKKSYPEVSKETGKSVSTIHYYITKRLGFRPRSHKESATNYWRKKRNARK